MTSPRHRLTPAEEVAEDLRTRTLLVWGRCQGYEERDVYLASVRITRSAWREIDFSRLGYTEAEAALSRFDLRMRAERNGGLREIDPHEGSVALPDGEEQRIRDHRGVADRILKVVRSRAGEAKGVDQSNTP